MNRESEHPNDGFYTGVEHPKHNGQNNVGIYSAFDNEGLGEEMMGQKPQQSGFGDDSNCYLKDPVHGVIVADFLGIQDMESCL